VAAPLAQTSSIVRWFCKDYLPPVYPSQKSICVHECSFIQSLKPAQDLKGPLQFGWQLGMFSQAVFAVSLFRSVISGVTCFVSQFELIAFA